MTPENLLAWSLHAAAIIAAGLLGAAALRWTHAASRHRFLQALLVLCLLLPAVAPRQSADSLEQAELQQQPASAAARLTQPQRALAQLPAGLDWGRALSGLLFSGALVRLALLALGLARLEGLRRQGVRLHIDGVVCAEIRLIAGLRNPATFGWLRPVILLPAGLASGPRRDSILRHELEHVLRRDWLEGMLERIAGAVLWFHPAIWILMERIQLAREQAVDEAVAGTGPDRDSYIDALLATAGLDGHPDRHVLPVAGFLRRRQLVERIAQLAMKESPTMTVPRIAATAAALSLSALGAVLFVSACVAPFRAEAQVAAPQPPGGGPAISVGNGVAIVTGGDGLMLGRMSMTWDADAGGVVSLEATLNDEGEVVDARVLSGPEPLRKPALQMVLNWRYRKEEVAGLRTVPVTLSFMKRGAASAPGFAPPPPPPPPPPVEDAALEGIDYSGLSADEQTQAAAILGSLRTGQHCTEAELKEFAGRLKAIHPNIVLGRSMTASNSTISLRLQVRKLDAGDVGPGPSGNNPPSRIRVGGSVMAGNLIHSVAPEYPPLAKQARIQGTVRFNAVITREGTVANLQLISGHPLLVGAAQPAAAQNRYRPVLMNGSPIEVITQIDVNFTLSQ